MQPSDTGTGQSGTPYGGVQPEATPNRDSALRIGLIFGVILALVGLLVSLIAQATGFADFWSIFNFGALVAITMTAGAFARRRFASGALAGLVTALTSTLINLALSLLNVTRSGFDLNQIAAQVQQTFGARGQQITAEQARNIVTTAGIITALVALLILALLGALFGWLGGRLFGRGRDATTYRT